MWSLGNKTIFTSNHSEVCKAPYQCPARPKAKPRQRSTAGRCPGVCILGRESQTKFHTSLLQILVRFICSLSNNQWGSTHHICIYVSEHHTWWETAALAGEAAFWVC